MSTSQPNPEDESVFTKKENDIRILYTKHMLHWGFGFPLYEPPSTNELKVGQCGYFDNGVWNPIAFVPDAKSVRDAGLQPMAYDPPRLVIDDSIRWGPQTSKTVKSSDSKVLVSATTLIEGGPLEGSIEFSLDGKTTFGAVLATEAPVKKELYYELSFPWSRWVIDNEATLVKHYENGVKKGLWIVLQTYSTPKAHITVLNNSKQTTRISFKVDIGPLGKSTPQGGWSTDYDMGSWVEYSSKGDDSRVVYVNGLFYSLNWRNKLVRQESLSEAILPQTDNAQM